MSKHEVNAPGKDTVPVNTESHGDKELQNIQLARTVSSVAPNYPGPAKLALIMSSLYICIFLIALDRTILGVAIPRITDEFNSLNDVGWYGSAYMLTACGFILTFGKIYTFKSTKWTFLSGLILFEIGSALCGAAPSSVALIIGRAIAGFGSSGIFTGAISILLASVPLHRRPIFQGLFGASFGLASVAGPLLGGAFTEGHLGWRWCFYINLPLGGFTFAALVLFLHLEEDKKTLSWLDSIKVIDPIGTSLFLPSIVCLLLALQWGGSEYPWSAAKVIICLVFFCVIFLVFLASQYIQRNGNALVPGRIFFQRSVFFGGLFQLCVGATMLSTIYYIPFWFQAIKGVSPVKSGIDSIPLILGVVLGSILSGALIGRIGYYLPFMYIGVILMSIGNGLLTTFTVETTHPKWIGYQAIAGLGVGFSMQISNLAVQTCLPTRDVPVGISIIFFFQTLGGAVFMSVAQNVFISKFSDRLLDIPGVDAGKLVNLGATAIRNAVPPELLGDVLRAYSDSIVKGPFLVATITACLSIVGCLGTEWRSTKEKQIAHEKRQMTKSKDEEAAIGIEQEEMEKIDEEEKGVDDHGDSNSFKQRSGHADV